MAGFVPDPGLSSTDARARQRPDGGPRRGPLREHRLRFDERRPSSESAVRRVDGLDRRGAPDRAARTRRLRDHAVPAGAGRGAIARGPGT